MDTSEFIIDMISHGNYVRTIFLDLAKYSTVFTHPILLQKMSYLGIKDSELA